MSSSRPNERSAFARNVVVDDDTLTVDLDDGRTIAVPTAWFPRLVHGSDLERANWRLIGDGEGIRWPDLDEDVRVSGLLEGGRSAESSASLQRWLRGRERTG